MEKIIDVTLKLEKDIETDYVSSIGGAVGGAVLFGALGAMIGGRVKKKQTIETTEYSIFTYNKGDLVDCISFRVRSFTAGEFVQKFRAMPKKPTEVDL